MGASFQVEILSPDGKICQTAAQSLVAPAALGYMGILANHAPIITSLVPGNITVRSADGAALSFRSMGGGFMEVSRNKVVLLVDRMEPAE
jgi:F-type H+-transporting ATPase subunit epsilon